MLFIEPTIAFPLNIRHLRENIDDVAMTLTLQLIGRPTLQVSVGVKYLTLSGENNDDISMTTQLQPVGRPTLQVLVGVRYSMVCASF